MFQFRANVEDSCPVLNQYCVFDMDSWNHLNATIKMIVAIPFKHKTLKQCCFIVGLASGIVIQHRVNRETNQFVYWTVDTLNAIPFDRLYLKVQKLSGDFWKSKVWSPKFQFRMAEKNSYAKFQSICTNKNNPTKFKMAATKTLRT